MLFGNEEIECGENKTFPDLLSSKVQKGGITMEQEDYFRQAFAKLIEVYQLDPDTAAELLQRILHILFPDTEESENSKG